MAKGKQRVAHPPVERLIAVVVVAMIVVLVSLAIGSLLSVTRVEPTSPDPGPLFASRAAELVVQLVQSA